MFGETRSVSVCENTYYDYNKIWVIIMKNELFNIEFNANSGAVTTLSSTNDIYKMNWCIEGEGWGLPQYTDLLKFNPLTQDKESLSIMQLKEFCETEISCTTVYENDSLNVTVERYFSGNGSYNERYTIKNLRETDYFLEHGTFGITLPFNDIYTYADDCMVNRCNTHIWCGGNSTYINALKMGKSDINLGLVLTKGSIKSYTVKNPKSNHRGIFILNPEPFELLADEEYIIEWQLFWHKGNSDFYKKAYEYASFINIEAPYFTVFENEQIEFCIKTKSIGEIKILYNGNLVPFEKTDDGCKVCLKPKKLGENRFDISVGNTKTYTEFFVAEELEKLLKKRINFIVENQQYLRKESPLYGAFLIYDNKEKRKIFDSVVRDHNACRERTGMALLLVSYLQNHDDAKIKESLDKYITFILREVFDSETGEIYDGMRKNKQFKRLYNAPWITMLFTEMYLLTKNKEYISYIIKILENYYSVGGDKFYPNGLSMRKTITAIYDAGLKAEADKVKSWYLKHTDNIVRNGLAYPKHEVNFEQTIVSPAATFISEMAYVTDNISYREEALKHIEILEKFNGHQPSFHLNEIPIRYWDDFWFGKSRLFGDTFPHYWSCLTARAFKAYYNCSNKEEYKIAAERCARNCLCLFNEKGEGSCAYVYPFKVNELKGEFYDEWANDQDFALYFYLEILK